MEFKIRKLTENDYPLLVSWWKKWKWPVLPKEFLPNNGTGGYMVEKNSIQIVAGFTYLTSNSKVAWLEWIISNPDYKEKDRDEAVETLIITSEEVCRKLGYNFMFSIGRNQNLINKHKKLGWSVDNTRSHELVKKIN
jgi:hypothetical protein|tara:strand:+ start:2829 stop:3239 length:411 start_codon:yes stop_codon:yes gene_type:complete